MRQSNVTFAPWPVEPIAIHGVMILNAFAPMSGVIARRLTHQVVT